MACSSACDEQASAAYLTTLQRCIVVNLTYLAMRRQFDDAWLQALINIASDKLFVCV
jgi:hypothetical protein